MHHEIIYRPAVVADAAKLSILYQQVYIQTYGTEGVSDEFVHFITAQFAPARLEEILTDSPGTIIVASYKDNLVGVAEIHPGKRAPIGNITAPELNKLYILEWFCGKGIGHRLLAEAERFALSLGATQLWLWVLESNHRAIGFYERYGFATIGTAFFQMEVNRYENLVMVKQLK